MNPFLTEIYNVTQTLGPDNFPFQNPQLASQAHDDENETEIDRPGEVDDAQLDEEDLVIRVPAPGMFVDLEKQKLRDVPGTCTICLSSYTVGSDVVWSSNESCEHVFHANCIERWLLKQREGPLCPCCRRDFVLDPFETEALDITSSGDDEHDQGGTLDQSSPRSSNDPDESPPTSTTRAGLFWVRNSS